MIARQDLEQEFERNESRYLDEWRELLRFPSVSSDPAHAADCRACAEWLAQHLGAIGFRSELLETSGKPLVFAERRGQADTPAVLFYGHYDVQPVDPLELWETPPFEPCLRDGRMIARGANDNKGQLFYVLKAMETLAARELPLPHVRVLLEGEEESGSRGISAALPACAERIRSDVLMVCDTGTVSSGDPTVIMGLRGIVDASVSLGGLRRDLHSGMHGGLAPNPAAELARLTASLYREDGSVAVDGFYEGIAEPTPRERELAARIPFDPAQYMKETGVPPTAGERAFAPAERLGFRPSLDVNGLHSGYSGEGVKTIIPAEAVLKLTARLAAGQDPERCLAAILKHLRRHAHPDLAFSVMEQGCAGPGFRLDPDSPLVATAADVLRQVCGREPVLFWEGASIPVIAALRAASGAEPLLVGFGREEDNCHAPNESFSIEQFKTGYMYAAMLLSALPSRESA